MRGGLGRRLGMGACRGLVACWALACGPPASEEAPAPAAPPSAAAAAAPDARELPRFDGEAALAWVARQLEFGPRIPGSEGHRRMGAWLEDELRARADALQVQRFVHRTEDGVELPLVNFLAHFNRSGSRPLLLLAHWDTRPISDRAASPAERSRPVPGANDGGSGTAVLLELAQMMHARPPPRAIDLLLVDGEDYGDFKRGRDVLLGSRYFASHLPPGYDPRFAVLLDMVGDRELTLYPEAHSQRLAPEVVSLVWTRAARLGFSHIFRMPARYAVEDDHIPLNQAGIPAVAVIDLEYAYWHTPADTLDKVSARSLGTVGQVMADLIYRTGPL